MATRWAPWLLVAFVGCGGPEPPQFDLAITGVALIDGNGGPARLDSNVYVRDGRIARITTGEPRADAREIVDGTGRYLIPGLVDGHAHPFPIETNLPIFARFGVTSIFVPGCGDCSAANMARARALADDPSVPSPRVYHTSPHFTMEGRHPVKTYRSDKWVEGETVYYVREVSDVAGYVEEVATEPILGIKVTIEDGPTPPFVERIPLEFVTAIVEEAHARDLEVFAHVSDNEELRIADEAGADHIIHFVGVDIDWARDADLVERLRQRGISWVTTLMIDKSFFYPARPEWIDAVVARGVFDEEEIERLRSARSPEDSLGFLSEVYGIPDPTLDRVIRPQIEDLRRLHDLGFNLVVGTDVGNDFIFPGLSMHEEMELLEMGFEPLEILRMATRNGAEMLGVLDDLGTLEEGKLADMVLLDQSPLDTIANTQSISAVFKAGVRQFSGE